MTWNKAPCHHLHLRRAIAWALPYETLRHVGTQGRAERLRRCVPNHISGSGGDCWP